MKCPNGHGPMELKRYEKEVTFKGERLVVKVGSYVCPVCGLELTDAKLARENQRAIADAYRKRVGLLTSQEIVEGRKRLGLSQKDMAIKLGIGEASVKRWELGAIQTRAMDRLMRQLFEGKQPEGDVYTGNRPLSLSRIKLVLKWLSKRLGKNLLVKKPWEKLLYAAKYLWYADMISYRERGVSMTGATYAALPYGPQLNNYRELIDEIKKADESKAEPLSPEEIRILERIVRRFPNERSIFDAAHREPIWKEKKPGELIPYTDANRIEAV